MNLRTKAILINATLAVTLAFELYRGVSVLVIAISAIVLFAVANISLATQRKKLKSN